MSHVELHNISKHFGPVAALKDISLSIERGTIHALVGENGAGKSTLGKIICGVIRPDPSSVEGPSQMLVNGNPVDYSAPFEAFNDGITMIAQELALIPRLSVLQNVFLGIESKRGGLLVDNRTTRRRYDELVERSGFSLPPNALVSTLGFAELRQVEILKSIARNAELIVMDEPTAALPDDETAKLLDIIRQLRGDGVTIVFVSHFLEEVLSIADMVTVLRDGEHIQTTDAASQTPDSIVSAMLGREMSMTFPPKVIPPAESPTIFAAKNIASVGKLQDISFEIRAGEIVGLAGLVGSGRSDLAMAMFGAEPLETGELAVDGLTLNIKSPSNAIEAGIALLPESRKTQGLLMNFPLAANITLPHLDSVSQGTLLSPRSEARSTTQLLQELDVRPPQATAMVRSLSGGNQQKVMFCKWLYQKPRLLIVDEPTHGVDVGARRAIYQLIVKLAADGMGILVISSELEEVMGLAHRILVMREGRLVSEFTEHPDQGQTFSESDIMQAAFATGV